MGNNSKNDKDPKEKSENRADADGSEDSDEGEEEEYIVEKILSRRVKHGTVRKHHITSTCVYREYCEFDCNLFVCSFFC